MLRLSCVVHEPIYGRFITGGPSSLQDRGRDSCLRVVLCYKRLFTKACMGCKRFFLKERKNVMFLNKIYLPYCLVLFFVYPRLRPFWGIFGELALLWCSTAKRKARLNSNFRSVCRSRRIIPVENYPRPQFLQKFKGEMLQFQVHSLDSQFLPQIVHQRSFFLLLDQLLNFELGSSKLPFTDHIVWWVTKITPARVANGLQSTNKPIS